MCVRAGARACVCGCACVVVGAGGKFQVAVNAQEEWSCESMKVGQIGWSGYHRGSAAGMDDSREVMRQKPRGEAGGAPFEGLREQREDCRRPPAPSVGGLRPRGRPTRVCVGGPHESWVRDVRTPNGEGLGPLEQRLVCVVEFGAATMTLRRILGGVRGSRPGMRRRTARGRSSSVPPVEARSALRTRSHG